MPVPQVLVQIQGSNRIQRPSWDDTQVTLTRVPCIGEEVPVSPYRTATVVKVYHRPWSEEGPHALVTLKED